MSATSRKVIDRPTERSNGVMPKATGHTPSPGRAPSTRRNGGSSEVPNRRLNLPRR